MGDSSAQGLRSNTVLSPSLFFSDSPPVSWFWPMEYRKHSVWWLWGKALPPDCRVRWQGAGSVAPGVLCPSQMLPWENVTWEVTAAMTLRRNIPGTTGTEEQEGGRTWVPGKFGEPRTNPGTSFFQSVFPWNNQVSLLVSYFVICSLKHS